MIPVKPFYMIRHGETEANAAQIMAGSLDSPLTHTGRAQARAVQDVVTRLTVKPSLIVHSNLSRARETASIINEVLDLPMVEDPDVAEIHAGDLEGVGWEHCHHFDDWRDMPNGERFQDFFERVRRAKNRHLGSSKGPVLIVSHGGVFRALAKMYGIEMWGVNNCHLHEFVPGSVSGTTPGNSFPWDVWHYDYEDELLRRKAESFYK
jgi:broad specificity phosphatase PhoE